MTEKILIFCPKCKSHAYKEVDSLMKETITNSKTGTATVKVSDICSHILMVEIDKRFTARDIVAYDPIQFPNNYVDIPLEIARDTGFIRSNIDYNLIARILRAIIFKQKMIVILNEFFSEKLLNVLNFIFGEIKLNPRAFINFSSEDLSREKDLIVSEKKILKDKKEILTNKMLIFEKLMARHLYMKDSSLAESLEYLVNFIYYIDNTVNAIKLNILSIKREKRRLNYRKLKQEIERLPDTTLSHEFYYYILDITNIWYPYLNLPSHRQVEIIF